MTFCACDVAQKHENTARVVAAQIFFATVRVMCGLRSVLCPIDDICAEKRVHLGRINRPADLARFARASSSSARRTAIRRCRHRNYIGQPTLQTGDSFMLTANLAAATLVCYNDTIFRDGFDGDGF